MKKARNCESKPAMPAPDNNRERSPLVVAAVVVVALPVLYVLSIGPVAWLQQHGFDSGNQFLGRHYAPIHYLADHCEVFRDFMRWWISLWGA